MKSSYFELISLFFVVCKLLSLVYLLPTMLRQNPINLVGSAQIVSFLLPEVHKGL